MGLKYPKEVIEYAVRRSQEIDGDWSDKMRKVISEVQREFSFVLQYSNHDSFRRQIQKWIAQLESKLEDSIQKLDDAIDERKLYELDGENVIFYVKKKNPSGEEFVQKYAIPFEELERIWYDYSEHGKNLSGKNVIIEHGIKRETLALLRSRLGLTKDDNAIPQVVLDYLNETYGNEAVEARIVEVTHRAFEDKYKRKFVKTSDQVFRNEAEKAIKIAFDFKEQLRLIRESIASHEPVKIDFTPKPHTENSDTLCVFFSDFHFGNGNEKEIVERFVETFDYIVSQPQKYVEITSLGDLGENFSPNGMHKGMLGKMSMHGAELMLYIANVFERFLIALVKEGKKVTFRGIGGNHDRMGEDHDEDMSRTIAILIYELIKRGLKEIDVRVEYFTTKISSFVSGDLNFIIHHGDDGFSKRKPEDILWKNGDQNMYNVILHGDKHNATVKETKMATMVGLPALAGRGEYDTRLDLHSEPGIVVITKNGFGTADVFLKRLP